jgi:organic radical activating enzyme
MNNTFCVLPWTHLCVRPDNVLKPCCRFLSDNPSNEFKTTLDDVYNQSEDAMNTEYFKSIRTRMLDGGKIAGCQKCYTQEENVNRTKLSARELNNKEIPVDFNSLTDQFHKTKYIEMSVDNICNLQCRICDSKFSSKLQKRDKFLGHTVFKKLEPNFHKLTNLDLSELIKVKVLGGEPFITPNFEKFIDFLFKHSDPTKIALDISTNGTAVPTQRIIKKLNKFQHISINVSLDAVDPANDYQRAGGSYLQTLANAERYKELIENCIISHHITVSVITANKLAKTISYLQTHNKLFSLDFVRDPEHYSLLYAPDGFKDWVLDINSDNDTAHTLLKNFIYQREHKSEVWQTFIDTTKMLDKYYNVTLEEYNSELYHYIHHH